MQYHRWRNQQIVLYFTRGFSVKEIAYHMCLPRRTVAGVFEKCGITKKRIQMVYSRAGGTP